GRTEMQETNFSMQDLVSECMQDLSSIHSDEQVITVCGPVPNVMADRALIRQVWINLLSNALKFSAGAGEPKVVVACSEEEGVPIFSVTDNGVGFDMKYADKLFNVFQRLHSSKSFEGTGVGLAIVRRIIERHNGKVWAHSEPGKGATFHFTINPNPNDKH
ncbi:MAG TPA: ATP-binding protein, partial [Bacteroidales bacterium]|nr:ATP-binding protein [Bacteroidales bacterium]